MTEPLIDGTEPDAVELYRSADEGAVPPVEVPLEAPEADVLDQALGVPGDDEEYRG